MKMHFQKSIDEDGTITIIYDNTIRYLRDVESNSSCYSDRMYRWDHEKFNNSRMKVTGNHSQMFDIPVEKIEKFLQEYFDDNDLLLVSVEEIKNVATGFPYWHFRYRKST